MAFQNETLSSLFGLAVIVIWAFALFPQVVLNQRRRDASGLSVGLLAFWLVGDVCGLFGTILTHQLLFQKLNSSYHLLIDAVLLGQWFAFRQRDAERQPIFQTQQWEDTYGSFEEAANTFTDSAFSRVYSAVDQPGPIGKRTVSYQQYMTYIAFFLLLAPVIYYFRSHTIWWPHSANVIEVGKVLAYIGAFLYISSRVPQFIHNYQRQSCIGLSVSSFLLATLANTCYVLSITLNPRSHTADGHWNKTHLWKSAPYMITAAGSFTCDLLILAQWRYYSQQAKKYQAVSTAESVA